MRLKHEDLTQRAAWLQLDNRTELHVRGRDRLRVLNNNCTADLRRLIAGQGAEAFVLDTKGMTIGHVAIFICDDRLEISTVGGQASALTSHLKKFIVSEDVDFVDRSPELGGVFVAGPQAIDYLSKIGLSDIPQRRLEHRVARVDSTEILVRRTDLLGTDGFHLVGAMIDVARLGEAFDGLGLSRCPPEVLEAIRIEHRMPKFGVDIEPKNLPQEIGRNEQAISFTKGCYLGQETVARLDALGHVNRHLCLLRFEHDDVPPTGFVIEHQGKPVVRMTSATWSPKLNAPIGLGFVRDGFHRAGQQFETKFGTAVVADPLSSA